MHERSFTHRDITARNVFFVGEDLIDVKLGDLGSTCLCVPNDFVVPAKYKSACLAPEEQGEDARHLHKSDVWGSRLCASAVDERPPVGAA